jgi:uncharacterized membrane protein YedE/YeeE
MVWLLEPWPWYVSGPLIGLTLPMLHLFINKPFGVSRSLSAICGLTLGKAIPSMRQTKQDLWSLYFVAGIIIGGYLAGNILSTETNNLLPLYYNKISGLGTLFLGGILVGFGSRYANGCTAGHSITGLCHFQTVSLIATISFFVGGVLLTFLRSQIN